MTPQEAEIIRSVFARLKAMGPAPADAEAAGVVEAQLTADRGAGLALVRALVMTDHARAALAAENEALKQEIARLEAGRAPAAQPTSGDLFGAGPWGAPQPSQQPQPPMAGPWGGQPQAPQSGGGFWSSALRTGAGVAGGLFAFEALRGLLGGGHGGWGGNGGYGPSSGLFDQGGPTIVNETVNVFEGDRGEAETGGGFFGGAEPSRSAGLFDDASDDVSGDDGGSFDGGDDWA